MSRITLYGFPQSTYTRTALMAAHEKGVAAELKPIAYGKPEHFALHPFGKMPAMTHDGRTIFETLAIVGYLDDCFDGPSLLPREAGPRAETLAAISVAIDYAYRPVVHLDPDTPDPDQAERAGQALDWLERATSAGGHVAGSSLTAADLFFAPMLAYHLEKPGNGATLEKRPALAAWFSAMAARPSFEATKAG
jgi:glutathione S-transferase